jgi:Cft2 family RNA processing exonuclease
MVHSAYNIGMIEWDNALRISGGGDAEALYLDSRKARARSFVSHAHTDHIAPHGQIIATPQTIDLAALRTKVDRDRAISLSLGQEHVLDARTRVRLHSAGHVLGSAMIHLTNDRGSLLYTGDFRLRESLTVPIAQPVHADVLIMETTYGKPAFRFPPRNAVATQLLEIVAEAMREGIQPIVMGYSLGKAQEIVRILTDGGFTVTEHGAVSDLTDVYQQHGVTFGTRRRYRAVDFKGKKTLPLEERGVLVAPPSVARSGFIDHFDKKVTIMCSGWSLLKGAKFRFGVDHALPISDHADFDELLEMVERVNPKKVLTLHGYEQFVDTLRGRGINADLARPDPQLRLFE